MSKALAANSQIAHYRVISKLGEGGMGQVWLAEDTRLGRQVALKLLPAEFNEDSERVRRFTQEAKAASALNHPNIISVYDIGECESGRFIVMEFVAGQTLRKVIASDNSIETFFTLAHQMARALSTAHAAGITHRDIKPDNIMVREDGYVKMLDFGLARLVPTTSSDPEAMTLAQQTTPGTVMGTLAYMSPEQAIGQTASTPSDVFALGIVLYELATGTHPFKSETNIGYLHAITSQTPSSMSSLKSHLPAALDDLILQMLDKDADRRPLAMEVAQALQEIEKYGTSKTLPIRFTTEKPKAKQGDEGFWVAVLPFKFTGSNQDVATLADGLTEEIVNGLSRFSYLRVISRSSTLRYATESSDVRAVGKGLGARYVMEGSVRQAGSMIRVAVQLVDTTTGAHLWAETYDRPFRSEDIFVVQDDLVPRIVSTVADQHGVLVHSMSESIRRRDPEQLTPYEAVLRCFRYYEGVTETEHEVLRTVLERAVKQAPNNADCWAMLAIMYCDEHKFGFNQLPGSLGRALTAAQRAVEISPTNPFAYEALSQTLFFRKEFGSFRNAAERAISLNPVEGATTAFMGMLIAFTGDWDYGCSVAEGATQLNPHHPGWYSLATFYNSYRKGDYEEALKATLKFSMPSLFYNHSNLAAVYGQLGDQTAARKALHDLISLKPDFASTARDELSKWLQPEFVEHLIEGFRKAGLEIGHSDISSTKSGPSAVSSEVRAHEGFWVAVLPIKITGSDSELATFAEGLSDEIITGLNRFSYLRVISRSSTLRYADQTSDVRTVGTSLGARYVMEGSLRRAGSKIRLAVQLVDATTGADLWAENYERTFSPDSVFELQDDLVPKIVSTVADLHGVLPRSMSDAVRSRPPEELSPYEAVLRSFGYAERVSREAFSEGLTALEAAVQKAPTYADAWAMLASLLTHDYSQGFNLYSDSLSRAEAAAHKAIELAPHNHLAWFGLANAHFFQKESQSFRHAAERAIALNPMDGNLLASLGESLIFDGESERGLELVERAKNLNPHHPGWYWYANFYQAYRTHDYSAALGFALKVNLPGHWVDHLVTAAAAGQTGDQETAAKAIGALLKIRPDAATIVRKEFEKWWRAEDVEHLIEGLRKAGLQIVDDKDGAKVDGQPVLSAPTKSTDASAPSIAVLPFVNISNDPDNDYFCDGLAEELLNALAKIGDLKVAARTSAFSFKGKNVSVAVIGKTLGVKTVLEGSVRYSAGRVRIAAQLINIADGYQIWSERYDRELRDVFDIQDEISRAIIDALKVTLLSSEREAVFKRYTENAEAYQLYLKGRYHYAKRTKEDMLKGIAYFRQAIELDSQFALAHAMIAQSFASMPVYPYLSPKEANPQVKSAVARALELDPNLAAAHVTLAYSLATYDWDWPTVEYHFKQAIEIEPNSDAPHLRYGQVYLTPLGRHEEAIAELERSVEIDPLSLFNNAMLAVGYMHGRQFEQAVEQAERVHDLEPTFELGRYVLALTYICNGMYKEAIALVGKLEGDTINQNHLWMTAYAYAKSGQEIEARRLIEKFKTLAQKEYVLSYAVASIYGALGDKDLAFIELEKAFVEHDWNLHRLNVDNLMDPLRDDPRFVDLVRRIGLRKNIAD